MTILTIMTADANGTELVSFARETADGLYKNLLSPG